MSSKKVLFVSQEITPYLPETEMSAIARNLPQGIQEMGKEIRTFMPKYGCINERRNQLHEVIRLSGMNLIIDDNDHPLIIKVASIQAARMQVYFIDNEDFFHRKNIVTDNDGNYFKDNDERSIFFARGVLETVKKLQWAPDLIHCHGWFTSLVPLYAKSKFNDDPMFINSKVVISLYDNEFTPSLDNRMKNKLLSESMPQGELEVLEDPSYVNLMKLAVNQSEGLIVASENANQEVIAYAKDKGVPVLDFVGPENYVAAYNNFYDKILEA